MKSLSVLGFLFLSASPVFADNGDPFSYISVVPSGCSQVREMQDMRTGQMEYIYIQPCNRAGFSYFAKLDGVRKVKENVIYVPKQGLGDLGSISGYQCSLLPKMRAGSVWSCTANGWTLYKKLTS